MDRVGKSKAHIGQGKDKMCETNGLPGEGKDRKCETNAYSRNAEMEESQETGFLNK